MSGQRMVPVEPTEEMLRNTAGNYRRPDGSVVHLTRGMVIALYKAMLTAAPASEPNGPQPCCGEYLDCELPCVPRGRKEVQYAVSSWLGYWRDKMPPEAVAALQDILDAPNSVTNAAGDQPRMDIREVHAYAKTMGLPTEFETNVATRILHVSDSFCPSCGHNRDKSAVNAIDCGLGVKECQMCGIKWLEKNLTLLRPRY